MHAQSDENPGEAVIDPKDAWLYNRETAFYQSDDWMVHYQKVLICPQKNPHSWVDCPFAHKGERAKRRDLRIYSYSSDPCDLAKKNLPCPKGDACDKSHHVYESWLHPELYRTRMCAAGARCVRRVCFFAHSQVQLRRPLKDSSSTAAGQSSAQQQQQQQQQDGTGGDVTGNVAVAQDADLTAQVEPWPESWGFGAAAATQSAQQQQQQQRLSSGSTDLAKSSKAGQRSPPAAGRCRAATPASGRVSAELAVQQQQQLRHHHQQQQPGTLHTASSGASAGLSLLEIQQQYVQQQQQQPGRTSTTSRQSSGGEACWPFAGLPSCSYGSVMQQQQQQHAATLSPDAAAAAVSPAGPWSPCSTNLSNSSSSRQRIGYARQQLSPGLAATAAAARPCSSSCCSHDQLWQQQQQLLLQQAIDAGQGGSVQQPTDSMTAVAAGAGPLQVTGALPRHNELSAGQQARLRQLQLCYPQQQQQLLHLLGGASSMHPLFPRDATATAAAADAALASLEQGVPGLKSPPGADAAATVAATAAARDSLVRSLTAAHAAAAAHELAQLQLLNHGSCSDMHFFSDCLGPGWGLIHGAGASLSRYGSGLHSSGSGLSSTTSGMARSSGDYAGVTGLTAPGCALTASGLTSSSSGPTAAGWGSGVSGLTQSGSSGLTVPGWRAAVSGFGGSGSSGLTAPGWGSALSDLAESGSMGLTTSGQGTTAPGWGSASSGQGHLLGQNMQSTALAYGHQQPPAGPQHTRVSQGLDPLAALHGLQQGVGSQACSTNVVVPQMSALQGVPELFPCLPTTSALVTGFATAYHRGLNSASTVTQFQTSTPCLTSATDALVLRQQMLDAAVNAQGAAAAAAAAAAGGMLPPQLIGDGSTGLQDSSRQAFWQAQQDNCNQQ